VNFSIKINNTVSDDFLNLAWSTFFAERKRGLSLDKHFPWLYKKNDSNWYVEAWFENSFVGGLVVKEKEVLLEHQKVVIACIGLVCIESSYRGLGIAKQLLVNAIKESELKKLTASTLWTSQAKIYESSGFVCKDNSLFGTVEFPSRNNNLEGKISTKVERNFFDLPPFADECKTFSTEKANLTVLYDKEGGIIADWNGRDDVVLSMLKLVLPNKFRINSRVGDSMNELLMLEGATLNLMNTQLQMWRPNVQNFKMLECSELFSVLDRI
jgi:hypothetical protein